MAKILVVEDEKDILRSMYDWLIFEDHEVFSATNGIDGLEVARKEHPDLIISDIKMPDMDGRELLLEVRSDPSLNSTWFIFVTASADRTSIRKGIEMGADDYITKPFTHQELINAVNSCLSRKESLMDALNQQLLWLQNSLQSEYEKNQTRSRLVAMFSHDFRNPLATIMAAVEMLENYADQMPVERKQKSYNRVKSSVHQLVNMLDETLLAAELDSVGFQCNTTETDVIDLISGIVDEFRLIAREKHKIHFKSTGKRNFAVDIKLFRHVLVNLISNAMKYSPRLSNIYINADIEDENMSIVVRDEGIGIPEKDIANLFVPFYRADNAKFVKGSGLGLSLVKQALDACLGEIEVESELDKGSTFKVYFSRNT